MREPFSAVRPYDHFMWSCQDADATESEVIELIAAFVRALKPTIVVEIGTHRGYCAEEIGHMLKHNKVGWLWTYEIDAERAQEAQERCADLPVHVIHDNAIATANRPQSPVDILFIDGLLSNREASWLAWRDQLAKEALVIVHDSRKYDEVEGFVRGLPLAKINLRTPRGLALCQQGWS